MMLGSPINSVHTNDSGEAPPEDHPEAPACCPGVPLATGMHNARPLTAPVMSRSSGAAHKHQRSSFTQSPTRLRSTSGPLISPDQFRRFRAKFPTWGLTHLPPADRGLELVTCSWAGGSSAELE